VESSEVVNHAKKTATVEIRWQARTRSDAKKSVPIDQATAEAITQQKRLFREKFGPEPGPEDPIFFDPVSSVPEFQSQEETWRALVQAAGEG
jgi:hypothetical protein